MPPSLAQYGSIGLENPESRTFWTTSRLLKTRVLKKITKVVVNDVIRVNNNNSSMYENLKNGRLKRVVILESSLTTKDKLSER